MKNTLIVSALTTLVLSTSCAAPKSAKQQTGTSNTSEHCIKADTCFVEVENEGRSSFYTSEEGYQALLTNPVMAKMNLDIKKIDSASYQAMTSHADAVKVVYNEKSPDQVNVYANSNRRPGSFTKIIGNLSDALSALLSVFSIGDLINGWINGNSKIEMTYHFGNEVIKKEVIDYRK